MEKCSDFFLRSVSGITSVLATITDSVNFVSVPPLRISLVPVLQPRSELLS